MNVRLLEVSKDALSLIYTACRQCYMDDFAGDLFEGRVDLAEQARFVRRIIASGHESPLEHVKFTFAIEGVSRVLTHQLVRHRLASYSQQSQRYVSQSRFKYIIPPSIEDDKELKQEFEKAIGEAKERYCRILKKLKAKGKGKTAAEDARFILPQAIETKIVVTMNCRELLHFFHQRCCQRAQWEIKALAERMLEICKKELPAVFSTVGAKCTLLGYCPEDKRFSCGRYPLKEEVIKR